MSYSVQEFRHAPALVSKPIAAVAVTAGTPVAIWTPAAGNKFRVLGFIVSLTVAGSVILKDATAEFGRTGLLAANTAFQMPGLANGYVSTTANNALNMDVTATGSVSGFVFGYEDTPPN